VSSAAGRTYTAGAARGGGKVLAGTAAVDLPPTMRAGGQGLPGEMRVETPLWNSMHPQNAAEIVKTNRSVFDSFENKIERNDEEIKIHVFLK